MQSETQLERAIKPRITNGFLSTRWRSSSSFFEKRGKKKKKKILCFAIIASDRFFDFSYPTILFVFFLFFFFSSSITFDILVRNIYNCCIRQKLKFYQENRNNRTTFYDIFYNFIRWFILARIYLILLCNNSIVPYFE